MKPHREFLTPAQLRSELNRCESCEEKPCKEACPADCSPADFIMAARKGQPSDFKRATTIILGSNPLGGICGSVCPDYHCMKACSRRLFDHSIEIPAVQATIIRNARQLNCEPLFSKSEKLNSHKIAIVGAGPAGIGAASILVQLGYEVTVFEASDAAGGMCRWIPEFRLDPTVLQNDLAFVSKLGSIQFEYGTMITQPETLFGKGFHAVIIATGLDAPLHLNIPSEEHAISWKQFLNPNQLYSAANLRVVVIGGGAIASDAAAVANLQGATSVSMITLEQFGELPLTESELQLIREKNIGLIGRTRVNRIIHKDGKVTAVATQRVRLQPDKNFHPTHVEPISDEEEQLIECDLVIVAIGARSSMQRSQHPGIFYAGDVANGPTTVVEAVASGKNIADSVDQWLRSKIDHTHDKATKSRVTMAGKQLQPVDLSCEFFGRSIRSPFLLSAAPPTDGYEQVAKAYRAGWSGAVLKTSFDNVDIHIPGKYMFVVDDSTYGNCDNVSGHQLNRVCSEVTRLVSEFPDRLTIGSTGGPVTGDDRADRAVWQSNTKKLELAGAMAIEYSLSCPQGGDGTKGDIVSQDAELTAKIIDWVMSSGDADIPKLFKLTGAVTAIVPIVQAIQEVFARYPEKQAGITLANSFPALQFRAGDGVWDDGYIVGLSGAGVAPISNLTLSKVANQQITVSGNGGPMDYYAAAHFLALGAKTVQFCTIAMKYGVHVIDELHSGLSHLLQARGFKSVADLIGCAAGSPTVPFECISATKQISAVDEQYCQHCGNCSRCPYLAIELSDQKTPITDPARCIGCSLCVQKCFSGALYMRNRTPEEASLLVEA